MNAASGKVIGTDTGLIKAFGIHPGEVISLVGGGGKTTMMFALARNLVAGGKMVISTTTTKIMEPMSSQTHLIVEPDEDKLLSMVISELENHRHITLVSERLASGKLKGIRPKTVTSLTVLVPSGCIIVEADGAAGKPLKAPNAAEPVIPEITSLVIPVVGIDALECRLAPVNVFRPDIVSELTGLSPGSIITPDAIATLITHVDGIARGSPARARIIPLINKMDLIWDLLAAQTLALKILAKRHPQIKRVILGQMQLPGSVVQIVSQMG